MVFQGFGRSYWTVSLDIGWFWERIVINQLSNSNIHLTTSLDQSSIAQFQLYGNYLVHRKIAIAYIFYFGNIINNHHNLNA